MIDPRQTRQMTSDFRDLVDAVVAEAQERRIEVLAWGDAVSLEFTDGCDALHVVPGVGGSGTLKSRVEEIFQQHTELSGRRIRVLRALLWICHSEGAQLGMRRSGFCRLEKEETATTVEVGRALTRNLVAHDDVQALQDLCGSVFSRFGIHELGSWLTREDPPPMPAATKEGREPPLDDATWAAQVEGMFPSLEEVFLPAERLPEITEEMLSQAEERSRKCLEECEVLAARDTEGLHLASDPPWYWIAGTWVEEGWLEETARRLLARLDQTADWWSWLIAVEVLLRTGDDTHRVAARQAIGRWWQGGGHDIQDHLSLLGLFPELESLVEDVLRCKERAPWEPTLLAWHLPTRRSVAFEFRDVVAEMTAAGELRERMQCIDDLFAIFHNIGPEWTRRLLTPADLDAVRELVEKMVEELPTHTLWVDLDRVAALIGALGWGDLADRLLDRPDLPSLLFSLPWQSLQQGGKRRSLSAGHTGFQEPLLSLALVRPGDPRLVRWTAFGLELQERLSVRVEDRLPLADAWQRCAGH